MIKKLNILFILQKSISQKKKKKKKKKGKKWSFCEQPKTNKARCELAKLTKEKYSLNLPLLVDCIENEFDNQFNSWPFRYYVVKSRKLIFKPSPELHPQYSYNISNVEDWLDKNL